MKTNVLLLLTTVAVQTMIAAPIARAASSDGSIVVAQADDRIAAARRALEQAQASLKQAEDTGGDVRGARKAVAAAMMDLRTAEAAGGGSSANPSPAKPPLAAPRPTEPQKPAANSPPASDQPKPYTPPAPSTPEPKAKVPQVKTPPEKAPPIKAAPAKPISPAAIPPKPTPPTPLKPDPRLEPKYQPKIDSNSQQQPAPAKPLPPPVIRRPPPAPGPSYDQPPPRRGDAREVPPPDYGDDAGPPRSRDYGSDRALPPSDIPQGRDETTTTEIRPNGVRILTITDRDGRVVRRIRVDRYGNRTVLSQFDRPMGRPDYYDQQPPEETPPRFRPGRDGYVLNGDDASEAEIEGTLRAGPILRPQRGYSIDEICRNSDLRDMVRRIDIDTITFDFGSDTVPEDQIGKLRTIGRAIGRIIDRNPREVFMIEGHTDAVGTDLANLELSDRRANSVADILSEYFDIPPENLVSQGYGERYLKVQTDGPERLNRRVTIRRITPLLRPGD